MQSSVGQQNNIQQPQAAPYYPQQAQIVQQNAPQAIQEQQIQPQAMAQPSQPSQPVQPQYQTAPMQATQPQNQNVQVPNYSGVNIQIFNPSVTPPGGSAPVYNVNAPNYGSNANGASGCYPSGYYTNNWGNGKNNTTNNTENNTTDKKTEKREIVQLTDDYIRNLENYLNSQDKEVRMMGAKEVIARLEEDKSRKDDKALNALINKMLQDPSTPIRVLALSALDSGSVTGDDFTVGVLKQMQNSQGGYGQDAMQATNVLLKMSGQKVEKEFEVKDNKKKTETKTETQSK